MESLDPAEPLPTQIRTNENEQDGQGAADTLLDGDADRLFTVNSLPAEDGQMTIEYYWPTETETIDSDEFRERFETKRYGIVSRGLTLQHQDVFKDWVFEAFEAIRGDRSLNETFEPLGLTFRDIRYLILLQYGAEALHDQ